MKELWSHKLDFILTVIGFALGVGVIWKFPYMCARNGGGSFLIPYVVFTIIGSIPLTYVETVVGQFAQLDCFGAWQICPSMRGLAYGSFLVSAFFFIYAPVLLAWSLYYLCHSFYSSLPWTQCGQTWNSDLCLQYTGQGNETGLSYNVTEMTMNIALRVNDTRPANNTLQINNTLHGVRDFVPSAEEFFWNNMLQITDSLENIGTLRLPVTGCLFIVSLGIYLCVVKGIRISGKIVYVTVSIPYIFVTVILVRSCTLPGSLDGILFYIKPDFDKLKDPKTWMEACGLAIYFMGIGFGSLIKMASHNPKTNNCLRDAVTLNVLTTCSMVYFGFSVFAITGHLAYTRGVPLDSYSSSGFKLGFITYPEATALLPLPQLWSVILFLMFFTLGLDSVIPPVEYMANIIGATFPRLARRMWLLNAGVVFTSFLLAVPFTFQGGVYLLTLVEWFAFFPSLAVVAFVELIVVGWIYGPSNLNKVVRFSQGKTVPKLMFLMMRYVCPVLMLAVFGYSFYSYRPPRFEAYIYSDAANVCGWFISIGVIAPIPVYFLLCVWRAPGQSLIQKIKTSAVPQGPWAIENLKDDSRETEEMNSSEQTGKL